MKGTDFNHFKNELDRSERACFKFSSVKLRLISTKVYNTCTKFLQTSKCIAIGILYSLHICISKSCTLKKNKHYSSALNTYIYAFICVYFNTDVIEHILKCFKFASVNMVKLFITEFITLCG